MGGVFGAWRLLDERWWWCAALLVVLAILLALVYAVWLANADLLAAVHTRPELFGLKASVHGEGADDVARLPPSQRNTPKKQR